MPKINPIQLEKFLKGVNYPISKDDLVKYAKQHGADENASAMLEKLPERTYDGPTGVSKAVGEIDRDEK